MDHLSPSPTQDVLSVSSKHRPIKTIVEFLHDRISAFISRGDAFSSEIGQLKIENDMVNTFFDEVHKLSDPFVFSFIESLKQDIELIIQTLLMSSTELATFYTFLSMILRRLPPIENAFANTLIFCKMLAIRINQISQSNDGAEIVDFNKFFVRHLFKNYC
jgi:hypothetical protein